MPRGEKSVAGFARDNGFGWFWDGGGKQYSDKGDIDLAVESLPNVTHEARDSASSPRPSFFFSPVASQSCITLLVINKLNERADE